MSEKLKVKREKYKLNKSKGITLVSLVITIVVLILLASVAIYLSLGNNEIFTRAKDTRDATNKQQATEIINLKITNCQMNKYAEEQRMPTLKELSKALIDDEIEYVTEQSRKQASTTEYNVPSENPSSIYTKLKKYPYEFEINDRLQLASIDGIRISTNNNDNSQINDYSLDEKAIGTWIDGKNIYQKVIKLDKYLPNSSTSVDIPIDYIPVDTLIFIDVLYSQAISENKIYTTTNSRGYATLKYNSDGTTLIQIRQEQTGANDSAYAEACILQYTKK